MKKFAAIAAMLVIAVPALAVDMYNLYTIDTSPAGLNIGGRPGSVAFNGSSLYVGTLFTGAKVHRIDGPLSAPSYVGAFGQLGPASGSTNGFVNLDVYGNRIVAGTNNGGGAPDVAYTFDLSGNLIGSTDSAALGIPAPAPNDRFDGAAVDPGWNGGQGAGVSMFAFGGGNRYHYDDQFNAVNSAFNIFEGSLGTGTRDAQYDSASGDLFIRYVNGIGRGKRVGPHNFETLSGSAGMAPIVNLADGFNSAINVDYLPDWNNDGLNLVLGNWRGGVGGTAWQTRIKMFDADVTGQGIAAAKLVNWYNADGTGAFEGLNTVGSIYDFSYDASTGLLAISDWSNEKIYIFGGTAIPEPATLSLLALGGLALIRRR